jgi:hypothetical protein
MNNDKDSIQLSAVEDHNGILTIRGGGAQRNWNGIHYKQGMSAKNVGTKNLSANRLCQVIAIFAHSGYWSSLSCKG